MAPCPPPPGMRTPLRSRQYVALVFDCARTKQRFPVRLAGTRGEGCGNDEECDVVERAIELRKTQVVTDGQPDGPARGDEGRRRMACSDRLRLVVVFVAVRESEEVDLVVAGQPGAVRPIYEERLLRPLGVAACNGYAAADHIHAVHGRHARKERLLRSIAVGLLNCQLVACARSHQTEILG